MLTYHESFFKKNTTKIFLQGSSLTHAKILHLQLHHYTHYITKNQSKFSPKI